MTGPDDSLNPEELAESAARDQLWASLRTLAPEIARLAEGAFDATERDRQVVRLLAQIVSAELAYRAGKGGGDE